MGRGIITRPQTIATAKRTKYSRRRADAVVEKPGAATVVMVILSVVTDGNCGPRVPRSGNTTPVERTFCHSERCQLLFELSRRNVLSATMTAWERSENAGLPSEARS